MHPGTSFVYEDIRPSLLPRNENKNLQLAGWLAGFEERKKSLPGIMACVENEFVSDKK